MSSTATSGYKDFMMIFIIMAGIVLLNASEGKNYTRAASWNQPSCNGSWCYIGNKDFPNLRVPMTGYNIIKGNPFVDGVRFDPGFSNAYIFEATHENDDGDVVVNEGVRTISSRKCSLSLQTEFSTTIQDYRKSVMEKSSMGNRFGLGLDAEVEAGVKGVGIKTKLSYSVGSAFSAEKTMKNIESFFSKEKGVIATNEATCTKYNIRFNKYNPPPFSAGFVDALEFLNSNIAASEKEKKYAARDFLNEFGTHYVHEVTMGARLSITRKYSQVEYATSSDNDVIECNTRQFHFNFFGLKGGDNTKICKKVGESGQTEKVEGYTRETITSYGSKPAKSLDKWAAQEFDAPLPIRMQLIPIINLFQRTYFRKYPKIDYKGILKFLAPVYFNYCEDNKDAFGVTTCDISRQNGCGWSDSCDRRSELCVDDRSSAKGYACKDREVSKSDLAELVKRVAKNNRGEEHRVVSDRLYKFLRSLYRNYYFVVNVYDPVSGNEVHAVRGDAVYKAYREYGRNIVVGWAKLNSRVPDYNKFNEIKREYFGIGTGIAVVTGTSYGGATLIYNDITTSIYGYPVSMVNVVDTGNGLQSRRSGRNIIGTFSSCAKWRMVAPRTIACYVEGPRKDVVVLFGEP